MDCLQNMNLVSIPSDMSLELTELAGGQKLVRLYDPSGNLIEVRTPFRCN